jgi:hypothetical protein
MTEVTFSYAESGKWQCFIRIEDPCMALLRWLDLSEKQNGEPRKSLTCAASRTIPFS